MFKGNYLTKFLMQTIFCFLIIHFCFQDINSNIIKNSELLIEVNTNASKKTVIIDAGHGGEDVGAIGLNNVYEKNLNMEIATKLGNYLSAAGYNVIYTRKEDRLLYTEEQNIKGMRKIYDLKNRVKIANSYVDAIFISIHMNSFGQQNCSGLQIYHSDNVESKILAETVQDSVKNLLQPNNRRSVKTGKDIYILDNTQNVSILIECGFISNPEECKKLSEKEYQKELCFSILCGIIEYEKNR
ncbi:MAG: N-acetylmuramoyl-L-alanine amidase [Clostridia bacterium]|nr:N-acetylmuramoyl-L-alanine amidase [Clostridia bacterium]